MGPAFACAMAGAASAHQAASATREDTSQQGAGRTRRTSADPQRPQQGATASPAAALAALDSLSRLQYLADASPRVAQLRRLQALADGLDAPMAQLAGGPEGEELLQSKFASSKPEPQFQQALRANIAGLSYQLKSGIESLSGLSLDYLPRHHNSSPQARLTALAYAQGSDFHLAPRQVNHQPHAACHMAKKAEKGDPRPIASTTQTGLRWLVVERGPVKSKQGLPDGYSISTNALLNRQHPAQLMSLFHGTTQKSADAIIENGVNTSLGKGEFGQGFYTVYSEEEAKHIIVDYYLREVRIKGGKQAQRPDGQVAVVEFNINDDEWDKLLYDGVHYQEKEEKEEKEEIDEADVDKRFPSRKETKYYAEGWQRKDNRKESLMVGKMKAPDTPYIQAVLGKNSERILNSEKFTTRSISWTGNALDKNLLSDIKSEIKLTNNANKAAELYENITSFYLNQQPKSAVPAKALEIATKTRSLDSDTKAWIRNNVNEASKVEIDDVSGLLYEWYKAIEEKSKAIK
jgi:hypothetical protein